MKRIIILAVLLLSFANGNAQSPQKMSFQAVIRNSSNSLVSNLPVGLKVSILQGTSSGDIVYSETQIASTNVNGLVTIQIGAGNVIQGDFSTIEWANGPYFIQTETDVDGGTNYTITSTTQLLSVPYALYAQTSGSSTPGPQGPQGIQGVSGQDGKTALINTTLEPSGNNCPNGGTKIEVGLDYNSDGILDDSEINASQTKYVCNGVNGNATGTLTHFIGELFGGGIVVSVWKDAQGVEHGLIASLTDLSSGIRWTTSAFTNILIGPTAQSYSNGLANTNAIVAQAGAGTTYAAGLCKAYSAGGFTDWYLPAGWEITSCFNAAKIVNEILGETNGFKGKCYYSSTESTLDSSNTVFSVCFGNDISNWAGIKSGNGLVRAVRSY
jgi:hypothetical protein